MLIFRRQIILALVAAASSATALAQQPITAANVA